MLRLNFYNGNSNFGDALAKSLVERLSGQMVVHGTCYESQLMAAGSVFGDGSRFVAGEGKADADASNQPLIVWGSGFLEPKIPGGKLTIRRRCDIRAVRGIHTREALLKCGLLEKDAKVALGDPGLFYQDLVPGCRETEKLYDVALVPHVLDRDRAVKVKKALNAAGLKVVQVDVLQANPLNCIREIAASKKVIASSMHALIVADSLGIPNRRLKFSEFFRENDKRQYDQSDFKFKDYYSAFGMESPKCMTEDELLKDPMAAITDISDRDFVPSEKVDACKCGLLAAFPESLKNEQRVTSAAKSPKLSVIIPVFNAELYLHECLASVLTQDAFGDFEVICVNDGSTDSSKDILSYWADRDARLKVLTQANQGPGVARNAGLAVAKGDYIMFLDADDRLTSGANLKVAFDHAMENRLDVAVMASNSGPCSDGGWRDNRHLRRELIPDKTVFEPEDIGINLYQFAVQEPWAKLYRREFVTANELEFPALKRSEDFPFVMSALLLSRRIGVLEVPLCDHRIGGALSLEATKDETPCIFIDATKWFSKAVQLQDRPKWVKMAAHISKVNRYAYNLKAVGRYSSFRLIVKCLCEEQDDFFLRVVECELPWYLAAYDFLNQIKQSAEDDAALIECFVSVQVKKQLEEQQKAVVVRDGWIRGLNRQVAGLKEACSKRDEWIKTLQSQLDQSRKATSERDKWLAAEKAKVARRDEWIRGFDGQIAGLREAVKKRDGRIVGLCEEIACKKTAIEKRDNCISRIEKELDQLDEGEMR